MKDLLEGKDAALFPFIRRREYRKRSIAFSRRWNRSYFERTRRFDEVCSLQLKETLAVGEAIDTVLRVPVIETGNQVRTMVGVGETSYHGPPDTSFVAQ